MRQYDLEKPQGERQEAGVKPLISLSAWIDNTRSKPGQPAAPAPELPLTLSRPPARFWLMVAVFGLLLIAWVLLQPGVARGPAPASKPGVPALGVVYISSKVQLNNPSVQSGAQGLVVTEVKPGSPASRAGLQPGDLITHLDDRPLLADDALLTRLASYQPGATISLSILRDTRPLQFTVILE